MEKAYLMIDIGTGNFRVGLVSNDGTVLSLHTRDMKYTKDNDFPDATSFDPIRLLEEIKELVKLNIEENPQVRIQAMLSTSQRQGIVLIDKDGSAIIGLPNVDSRGQQWELKGPDFQYVYNKTGRWPTKTFSALKLKGVKERQPQLWNQIASFTSISDWIGYEFTNQLVYENSQASETLLLDIQENLWCNELCEYFGIKRSWLPEIKKSGTILDPLKEEIAQELHLNASIPFIIGGADTQLAVKGTQPEIGDVVIVSGTTTPITKVVSGYLRDDDKRCWVSRHVADNQFLIECNASVTGLNYQRFRNIFFPNKSYEEMEDEVLELHNPTSIASFGTSVCDKQLRLTTGGFLSGAPIHHDLKLADFVFAILFDIASSIKYNFDVLDEITPITADYVIGSSGGFQSKVLPQMLSELLNKKIIIKDGYRQASLIGGVSICNETLGEGNPTRSTVKTYTPTGNEHLLSLYEKWKAFRQEINKYE